MAQLRASKLASAAPTAKKTSKTCSTDMVLPLIGWFLTKKIPWRGCYIHKPTPTPAKPRLFCSSGLTTAVPGNGFASVMALMP